MLEPPQAESHSVDMVRRSVSPSQPRFRRVRLPVTAKNIPPSGSNNPNGTNIPIGVICRRLCGAVVVMLTAKVCTPPDVEPVPTVHIDSDGAPAHVTVTVGKNPVVGVMATETLPFAPATTLSDDGVAATLISTTD